MSDSVWHTNTKFSNRYGLKLKQHQTLPPTPEHGESNESDVEADSTENQNGGPRTSALGQELNSPVDKVVFCAESDDDAINSRTRPKSAPEQTTGSDLLSPEQQHKQFETTTTTPRLQLYSPATDVSSPLPSNTSNMSSNLSFNQSFTGSLRRNVPPLLQSVKQTSSVSSDERGPQTPFHVDTPTDPKSHRWSLNQLRKQFQEVKIEDLYQRFWLRLQQTLLIKLLVVMATCIIIFLILYNALVKHDQVTEDKLPVLWTNLFLGLSLLLCAICFGLVFNRRIFSRFSIPISVLTWICLMMFLYAFMPFPAKIIISPTDNVPMTFFVIFVIYTMLPSPRRVVLALGCLTAVMDLIAIGVYFNFTQQKQFDNLILLTNFIVYASAIVTGFYHKHLMDLAHRHTFLDVRKFIEEDIQITKERDRQNRMKEGLLLKIIPKHLLEGMKKVLNKNLVEVKVDSKNMFSDMKYESNEGISILYADIVSFTPLTMSLTPAELVCALNELFGRFDELAKANGCLRIKILGDCYYCVAGLPDPTKDHARNAVIMGMQMIKVIARIREETGLEKLNMRIGIHSGHLLSGVLGLKKWQYDVWSDDVTIANHMESSGKPGKVHITAATLAELKDEFQVVEAHGKDRDTLLRDKDIKTFFIADHELQKIVDDDLLRMNGRRGRSRGLQRQKAIKRRISMFEAVEGWGAEMPFEGMTEFMMSGTLPALHEVNKRLEKGFHLQRSRNTEDDSQRLRKHKEEINQKTLLFRNALMEEKYANQLDESFKFYVICAVCIFAFLTTVQLIQFRGGTIIIINLLVGGFIFLVLIVISTGLKFLPFYERIPRSIKDLLDSTSQICVSDFRLKIILNLIASIIIFVSSVIPLIDCHSQNSRISSATSNETVAANARGGPIGHLPTTVTSVASGSSEDKACLFAPYFLYSCMMALIASSVFLRVSYIFKIIYMTTCLLLYNIMFYVIFPVVFSEYDANIQMAFIQSRIKGTLDTALLFVTLVVLSRQIEQNLRLDFLCKSKIQIDRQELKRNEMLNNLLLNNILPKHVAEHFTNPKRRKNELYHQLCKNAVVIFAAVPNFKAFFSEIDVTGVECLRMLNEIISAFDEMLIMRQYDGVEKIKTIGSTYMAASGLVPSEDTSEQSVIMEKNLVVMIQFAFGMMRKLEELSKDAFYEYKLKIGMCHGEVIAGVVGAQKPQYDIWGDTVNTASRMESHGLTGAIQVPEETAKILQNAGYPCEYRDEIEVKGKGRMKVYLVPTLDKKSNSECNIADRECRRARYGNAAFTSHSLPLETKYH